MDPTKESAAFDRMTQTVRAWAAVHLDQWEKFRFETPHGTVFVTISREDLYPETFEMVG